MCWQLVTQKEWKMRCKGLMASALALAVLSVMWMATPSWAAPAPIPCTGPLGAVEINGNISAGAGCDLSGASVRGNVTVNPGGSLTTRMTLITGNVQGTDAVGVRLERTTSVRGNLRLTDTTGRGAFIEVREGTVNGNVEIEDGLPLAQIFEETVGGNVKILNNSNVGALSSSGLAEIIQSTVGRNVEIGNNSLTGEIETRLLVAGTSVAGNLLLYDNSMTGAVLRNRMFVAGDRIGGNAELLDNITRGPFEGGVPASTVVQFNAVTNILNCAGNELAPIGRENTAEKKLGQCELL
jgi:hypothetical protein